MATKLYLRPTILDVLLEIAAELHEISENEDDEDTGYREEHLINVARENIRAAESVLLRCWKSVEFMWPHNWNDVSLAVRDLGDNEWVFSRDPSGRSFSIVKVSDEPAEISDEILRAIPMLLMSPALQEI